MMAFLLSQITYNYYSCQINVSQITHQLNIKKAKKTENILFLVVSIVVLLFISTRDIQVGTDTKFYVAFFESPNFLYNGEKTDYLFEQFARVLRTLGFNDNSFIFISGLLSFVGPFYLIWKTSKKPTLSLILFMIVGTSEIFFFLYFNVIRQCISISYFLFSIFFLYGNKGNKQWRYALFVIFYLAAVLTHGSTLITLPFIAVTYYKPLTNKRIWTILIVSTYIMSALNISFVSSILDFVFKNIESDHYSAYATVGFGIITAKGWFNMNLLPYMALGSIILYFSNKKDLNDYKIQFSLWSIVLNNIFFDNLMWSRLIMCLSLFMIISVPNILCKKSNNIQLWSLGFIFLYYIHKMSSQLIFSSSLYATGNIIVPYKSWLLNF